VFTGEHQRGVQLHVLRDAVTTWDEKYGQRAWMRQLEGELTRVHEDRLMDVINRLDGRSFPSTVGLARQWYQARAFYGTIAVATLIGTIMNFLPIDPIKALFWSAVINGVVAVPIMAIMMLIATRHRVMGEFRLSPRLRFMGWLSTAAMALAALGMIGSWIV